MKALLISTLLLSSLSAMALTDTATVKVKGHVDQVLEILAAGGESKDLDLGDITKPQSGSVEMTEKSNSKSGYSVNLSSTNGGVLKSTLTGATVAYTVTYGTIINQQLTSALEGTSVLSQAGKVVTPKQLTVATNGDANLLAATDYEDTITFTISSNF